MRPLASSIIAFWIVVAAAAAPSSADSSTTLNQQGVVAFGAGDVDSAVFYFEQALRLDDDNRTIRTNLSNAYDAQAAREIQAGEHESAIALCESALRADPTNAAPLIRLGFIFLSIEENQNAILRLEEAIELAPESPEAHFLLGEAYYRDNDVKSALEQWEWVHEVSPTLPGLKDRLATARREASVEGEYDYKESRRFSITHNPDLSSGEVRSIIQILERAYRDVGRQLSNTYPPGPIQVTLYAAEEFSKSTLMGAHIGGLFDGTRIRCPVLTPEGELVDVQELEKVLYHEYVHVVVRYIAPMRVPWWMNEGLAEALSHDVAADQLRLLRNAKSADALFPMKQLEAHQLEKLDPQQLAVAYVQSHAVMEYLIDQHGMLSVVSVLKRIEGGEQPEDALRKACRTSYETLDMALAEMAG